MGKRIVYMVLVALVLGVGAGCSKPLEPVTEIHVGGMPLDTKSAVLSKLATPVAPDAVVQVPGKQASITVNIFPADANGNPKVGATPEVILAKDTDHFELDDTMSKERLGKGDYLMNIVFGGKTERVAFAVK